jgi:hypothetical protein
MKVDKSKFKDSGGRPITQALFLEIGYTDNAYYTLKDEDYEYKGKVYPSLKRLFLDCEDPTEYHFATTYLLGWQHWQRMCKNKVLSKHFSEWREELELKVRSQAIRDIIDMSADERGFQAAKYLADKGWDKGKVGRPKKDTSEHDRAVEDALNDEFSADVVRLNG